MSEFTITFHSNVSDEQWSITVQADTQLSALWHPRVKDTLAREDADVVGVRKVNLQTVEAR